MTSRRPSTIVVSDRRRALSVSVPIRELLAAASCSQTPVLVSGAYRDVCNLKVGEHDLVSIVCPDIGDGPANVVVESGSLEDLPVGSTAGLYPSAIRVGPLSIQLEGARSFDPSPDWRDLRGRIDLISSRLAWVREAALAHRPTGSLLELLVDSVSAPGRRSSIRGRSLEGARGAAESLWQGWAGDLERLGDGARRIAGLGTGLTPAGDDFLAGYLLYLRLFHPAPDPLIDLVRAWACRRTSFLSAALIRSAAAGQCSTSWHDVMSSLSDAAEARSPRAPLERAVRRVLSYGATSGGDMMAGFLWVHHRGRHPSATL